jgi:hypothetical protein
MNHGLAAPKKKNAEFQEGLGAGVILSVSEESGGMGGTQQSHVCIGTSSTAYRPSTQILRSRSG